MKYFPREFGIFIACFVATEENFLNFRVKRRAAKFRDGNHKHSRNLRLQKLENLSEKWRNC